MKEIYEKYRSGDSITDSELSEGVNFFKDLSDKLYSLGDTFRLAAVEANSVYIAFYEFQKARRRGK